MLIKTFFGNEEFHMHEYGVQPHAKQLSMCQIHY